jgi:hypothetical protein
MARGQLHHELGSVAIQLDNATHRRPERSCDYARGFAVLSAALALRPLPIAAALD